MIDTAQRAQQWSDSAFQSVERTLGTVETLFVFLFATPAGWCILGVVVLLIIAGLAETAPPQPYRAPPRREPPVTPEEKALREERARAVAEYLSPAGYRNGVKIDPNKAETLPVPADDPGKVMMILVGLITALPFLFIIAYGVAQLAK